MTVVYIALVVLATATQAYSQFIPPCAPGIPPVCGCSTPLVAPAPAIVAAPTPVIAATPAVITTNSVAANLADTLSLLTVTSLLAETLPYSCPAAPVYPGCGCGYGYLV